MLCRLSQLNAYPYLAMADSIFTYGSLMFDAVWTRVVRGQYVSCRAKLDGFQRWCIRGETYPALLPTEGASVQGILYSDLSTSDLALLDAFEGSAYERILVEVVCEDGRKLPAYTYQFLEVGLVEDQVWQAEAFQLQRFLDTYCKARL